MRTPQVMEKKPPGSHTDLNQSSINGCDGCTSHVIFISLFGKGFRFLSDICLKPEKDLSAGRCNNFTEALMFIYRRDQQLRLCLQSRSYLTSDFVWSLLVTLRIQLHIVKISLPYLPQAKRRSLWWSPKVSHSLRDTLTSSTTSLERSNTCVQTYLSSSTSSSSQPDFAQENIQTPSSTSSRLLYSCLICIMITGALPLGRLGTDQQPRLQGHEWPAAGTGSKWCYRLGHK